MQRERWSFVGSTPRSLVKKIESVISALIQAEWNVTDIMKSAVQLEN